MATLDTTILEASVEALIQQQVGEYEERLRKALGHKLVSGRRRKQASKRPSSSGHVRRRTKCAQTKRTAEELSALSTRFLSAVEVAPGETMLTLAAGLGLSAKELWRPVQQLKKDGKIKSIGERKEMRYYPMVSRAA